MRRKTLLVALALVTGVAFAQDVTFDPRAWGSDPRIALLALMGAVAWLRQTRWGTGIDGPVRVAAVTGTIGVVGGIALQIGRVLTVEPFATYAVPLGGALYGLALAFSAVTGIAIFNYLGGKVRTVNVSVPMVGDRLSLAATSSAQGFILDTVAALLPPLKLPAGLQAVAELLAQFAQSELVLTDDVRADLQRRVLAALRKAGVVGVDV